MTSIKVSAGRHPRRGCPIRIPWSEGEAPASLTAQNGEVSVQRDGDSLAVIMPDLQAGAQAEYRPSDAEPRGLVRLMDDGGQIRVGMNGEEFTIYRFAGVVARPYFWPLHAPGGIQVTRSWPMANVPGEMQDHPHHRSLYFAFGSANGADNWSEEKGHGHTVHRSVDELVSGPVFGRFSTTSDWTTADDAKILTQRVTVTFWRGDVERRLMDIDLRLEATEGDVLFGDTKEGGLVTVRVASSMDVPRGGRITNAYGGIDEGETWGRAAHWCDYSGEVKNERVGIAVMDHPDSFRYPTYWHVRDYGLMGANPFALGDYTGGKKNGSHLLKAGDTLRFVYRVVVHRGDAEAADIRNQYLNFVSPPAVEVTRG